MPPTKLRGPRGSQLGGRPDIVGKGKIRLLAWAFIADGLRVLRGARPIEFSRALQHRNHFVSRPIGHQTALIEQQQALHQT